MHDWLVKISVGIGVVWFATNTFASQVEPSIDTIAHQVHSHVNHYRVARGLRPLVMNATVSQIARKHSQDMADQRVSFGHSGFRSRIHGVYQVIVHANAGAENVAYNYKSAQRVVDGWVHSSGHRHNIMGRYNLTGIGIAKDRSGRLYYTQLFVRTSPKKS